MVAWINAGASLAERFEGFLGTGWVRPSMDSPEWHMLYRFDSDTALDRWEDSDQRRWWLQSAQGIVGASVVERAPASRGGSMSRSPPTSPTCGPARPRRPGGNRAR